MRKYLATIILSVFLIAGCESEQASQPQSAGNSTTTSTAQPDQPAVDTNTTATDTAVTETTAAIPTDTAAVKTEVAQATQQSPRTGEEVYQAFCSTCHKIGVANAPVFADKAAWAPRIAKGIETLYQSSMNGVAGTAMTPKGSCMNCSEDELKAAVDYMVQNAQ